MRPRGEYRSVLFDALSTGPAPCRELAERACVGVDAARYTLDNMRRASEVSVTYQRVTGVKRPVPVYELAKRQASAAAAPVAANALQAALGGWWVDALRP